MSGMFKPLQAEDIECRVAQVNKDNSVNLLLYKTARTDANILDDVIGQFNWQCEFKEVNGVVYCGIGILEPSSKDWIWKWDAGAETKVEQEKGQASDAFKRAGFKWGIGRELYNSPKIRVKAENAGVQDGKCYTPFKVETIEYDETGNITKLVIVHAWKEDVLFQWFKSEPNNAADRWDSKGVKPASKKQVDLILKFYKNDDEKLQAICDHYGISEIWKLSMDQASEIIKKRIER